MEGVRNVFDSGRTMRPKMTDETVRQIASENRETQERRLQLREEVKGLREALAMINNIPVQAGLSAVSPSNKARCVVCAY